MCNFTAFWHLIKSNPEFISAIKGFNESIRKFVCHVINITYNTIEMDVLRSLLGDVQGSNLNQPMIYKWKS